MPSYTNYFNVEFAKQNVLPLPELSTPWLVFAAVLTFIVVSLSVELLTMSPLPWANYSPFELTYYPAKLRFILDGANLIQKSLTKYKGPFQLVTDSGPIIVFPATYHAQLDAHKQLDFPAIGEQILFGNYPGFEVFKTPPEGMLEEVIRIKITRNLPKYTPMLSAELDDMMKITLTDKKEWHDVVLKEDVLKFVSRMSSLVFVGEELGRNDEWNRIAVEYTVAIFTAIFLLHLFPSFLQPIMQWILPQCITIKREMAKAEKLLMPVIKARAEEERAAIEAGETPPVYEDALTWAETAARGRPYNPVSFQAGLFIAAIHTTSDLLCQAIYNLCELPELVEELREEAVNVLSAGGWTKASLLDLKLMDSFLKETQRLKPVAIATMQRYAKASITLADGTIIPQGTITNLSAHRMTDPTIYPSPEVLDPYRFLRMRDTPGQEHKAGLVSTSIDHIGFSHGKHACPGRFFAASEIKIALVHFLLKYDFRFGSGRRPKVLKLGTAMVSDSGARIAIRRREKGIVVPTV